MPPEPLRRGPAADDELERALERVRAALRGLGFGTVTLTVHDGAIVQIDRTERLRLDRPRDR